MQIADCIAKLKNDIAELADVDQTSVVKKILKTKNVFFLDTCFVTRLLLFTESEILFDAFERIEGGTGKDTVVFVITGTVLYEMKDSKEDRIGNGNMQFLTCMKAYGFELLFLEEEKIKDEVSTYLSYKSEEWNEMFIQWLRQNVAILTYLSKAIKSMDKAFREIIYDEKRSIPKNSDFIVDLLSAVKEQKHERDSLAEELICVSMFFLFEVASINNRSRYCFCSADLSAITRLRKAVHEHGKPVAFETMQILTLIQYMVNNALLTDIEEVEKIITKISGGGNISLVIVREPPYDSKYVLMTPEEVAENMFKGEVQISFTGKRDI